MAGPEDPLVDVEALYSPSEPQDDELPPLPPEDLLETGPPVLVEGQTYFSSGLDEDGDTQCGFVWLAERVAIGHDVFCRPRFLFSDDPYWDWWAASVGERGGITRKPLMHVCQAEPCPVGPPAGCTELVHLVDAKPLGLEEIKEIFASMLGDNPSAVWPADLFGPRIAGRAPPAPAARRPAAAVPPGAGPSPLDDLWGGRRGASPAGSRKAQLRGKLVEARDRFASLQQQRRAPPGADVVDLENDDEAEGKPSAKRSLAQVLDERASKAAKAGPSGPPEDLGGAAPGAAAPSSGASNVQELLMALLKALQGAARGSDEAGFSGEGGVSTSDGDLLPKGLASRRAHCRKLALEHPGRLAEMSLAQMVEYLGSQDGSAAVDPHGPNVLRFLLSVYLPQHPVREIGAEIYREMRTLAEAMDLLLQGRTAAVADILAQRFKAIQVAVNDGDWSAAKWLELIPPRDQPLALRNEEEEMIRSIQHGELKLEELASRLRKKPQG